MEGSRGHGTDDTLIISQFRLHTDLRTFTGKHATNGNYPLPDIYRLNKAAPQSGLRENIRYFCRLIVPVETQVQSFGICAPAGKAATIDVRMRYFSFHEGCPFTIFM
jgi:hypothetical protein